LKKENLEFVVSRKDNKEEDLTGKRSKKKKNQNAKKDDEKSN